MDVSYSQALAPVHEELMQRLNNTPQITADLDAIKKTVEDLTAPLARDIHTVRYKNADGQSERKRIVLGETVLSFEHKVAEKQQELEGLWQEWEKVQRQIVELGIEMLGSESGHASDSIEEIATKLLDETSMSLSHSVSDIEAEAREDAEKRKVQEMKWKEILKIAA